MVTFAAVLQCTAFLDTVKLWGSRKFSTLSKYRSRKSFPRISDLINKGKRNKQKPRIVNRRRVEIRMEKKKSGFVSFPAKNLEIPFSGLKVFHGDANGIAERKL